MKRGFFDKMTNDEERRHKEMMSATNKGIMIAVMGIIITVALTLYITNPLEVSGNVIVTIPEETQKQLNSLASTNEMGSNTTKIKISKYASSPECANSDSCFLPYIVETKVGHKVTWINTDSAFHTVTSGNFDTGPSGLFHSELENNLDSLSFVFEKPGEYSYFCQAHPWANGLVIVD